MVIAIPLPFTEMNSRSIPMRSGGNYLTPLSASGLTTGCTRNELSRRLSQFKNGETILNAGLTQVLQDGANTYLYGVNPLRGPCRIAQVAETQTSLP